VKNAVHRQILFARVAIEFSLDPSLERGIGKAGRENLRTPQKPGNGYAVINGVLLQRPKEI